MHSTNDRKRESKGGSPGLWITPDLWCKLFVGLAVLAVIAVVVFWCQGAHSEGEDTPKIATITSVAAVQPTTTTTLSEKQLSQVLQQLDRELIKIHSEWYAALAEGFAPGTHLGIIRISSIGVEEPLLQGTGTYIDPVMRDGTIHWPMTAMPGQGRNVVISGHRVTYARSFQDMDQVQLGDEIVLELEYATVVYLVTSITIVPEDESGSEGVVVYDHDKEEITLQTCHPKGSHAYRIVVQSDCIVSFELNQDWLRKIWAETVANITGEGN